MWKTNLKNLFLAKISLECNLLPHRMALLWLEENIAMIF